MPLDGAQQLERFCTEHDSATKIDTKAVFKCTETGFGTKIYCRKCAEVSGRSITDGVFLRHVGCPAKNPFWDSAQKKVIIDGKSNESFVKINTDFASGNTRQLVARHWIIGILRKFPDNREEMWFPQMMLRSTCETDGLWQRTGAMLELVGPADSGKSVLAFQASNYNGYNLSDAQGAGFGLNNFIYSRTPETASQKNRYLETLHLATLLHDNNLELYRLQGTDPEPGHLKVCFLKPADRQVLQKQQTANSTLGKTLGWTGQQFFNGAKWLTRSIFSSSQFPFWYTLIFYDSAGELYEKEHQRTELAAIEKVVILINAAEIFGLQKSEESLRIAWQRIEHGIERGKDCFLVVTQLDRAREITGEEEWQQIQRIADDLDFKSSRDAKKLLKKWLGRAPESRNKQRLRQNLSKVNQVFFIWTDDLPNSFEPARQTQMPTSHGIAKFVCACLGVKWSNLCQLQINKED